MIIVKIGQKEKLGIQFAEMLVVTRSYQQIVTVLHIICLRSE
jgi:hypothetical protein